MADGYRKGRVFVQNIYGGLIEETQEGYSFTYDTDYLKGKSVVGISLFF